jgi:hypothetical protein
LRVPLKSSSIPHEIVERALAVMSERWMTDIMEKGGRFAEAQIEWVIAKVRNDVAQSLGDAACDLGDL